MVLAVLLHVRIGRALFVARAETYFAIATQFFSTRATSLETLS
ncbi:hypothetical protein ABIB66_007211 [Bradyrhizobium sp. F1.13.3]